MAAYSTPDMPQANTRTEADLKTLMDNSTFYGVYELPDSNAGSSSTFHFQASAHLLMRLDGNEPKQVGLARVVTDNLAFAWGGDLYILPGYRRRGLAKWLLECIGELVKSKPQLYSICTAGPESMDMVEKIVGMKPWATKRPGAKLMFRRNMLEDVL